MHRTFIPLNGSLKFLDHDLQLQFWFEINMYRRALETIHSNRGLRQIIIMYGFALYVE